MATASHDNSEILGIVLLTRHGDRRGFYQDPLTYTPFATSITPLGEVINSVYDLHRPIADLSVTLQQEEFFLGNYLKYLYLNPRSSLHIDVDQLFNQTQVQARADAGGEGGVIFDSSIALLQGLFPPTYQNKDTLANGTTVVAPLGGRQITTV